DQLSTVDIGKEIGVNASSVLRCLRKFDIKVRNCSSAAKKRKGKKKFKAEKLNNKDWLYQKYITEQLTSYQVAELANSNQKSVFTALKRHNISTRTISEAGKLKEYKSKYKELESREWLCQKYIEETQSSKQMAKLIGCDSGNVIRALRKFDIKIRDNREARRYVVSKSFYYELLNDKEWLEQKYVEEKCSTRNITKLCGAKTPNSARQSLLRHNINVRNISEGLTCNREEDGFIFNIPVIEGSLLGDAGLGVYNRKSNISNPRFYKKNIGKDHIEYVYKQIFNKNRMKIKKEISFPSKKWGFKKEFYTAYSIRSLSHKELKPLYRKWYPEWNNYKKVIPEDIDISPVSLLNWFMDDGTSYQRRKNSSTKQVVIILCSECFTKDNQQMIVEKIDKEYGKICKVFPYSYKYKGEYYKRHRIRVYQSQSSLFYDIIGSCPVPSMEYKWKL
ncbi:MAG: hypothetical protein ACTSSP_00095, partial [Candidatus Asgardarchaeia archaeon]